LSSGTRLSRRFTVGWRTTTRQMADHLCRCGGQRIYTRAVSALALIAAVRRVRQPCCKFDEMMILEQPTQGTEKSSALAVLAVREEWFTDDLPLNVEGKRVIEALRGKWIVEAAELSGMKKADIAHLNALL